MKLLRETKPMGFAMIFLCCLNLNGQLGRNKIERPIPSSAIQQFTESVKVSELESKKGIHLSKTYTAPDGKFLILEDLPLYFFTATEPNGINLKRLENDKQLNLTNPLFLNGHEIHRIKDLDYEHDHEHITEVYFEIYADGIAPVTKINFLSETSFQKEKLYTSPFSESTLRFSEYSYSAPDNVNYKSDDLFSFFVDGTAPKIYHHFGEESIGEKLIREVTYVITQNRQNFIWQ